MLGNEIPYDMILNATAGALAYEFSLRPELGAFELKVTRGMIELTGVAEGQGGARDANKILKAFASGLPTRSLVLLRFPTN